MPSRYFITFLMLGPDPLRWWTYQGQNVITTIKISNARRQTVKVVGALYSYKEVVRIRSIADQDVNPSPNGTIVAVLEFWKNRNNNHIKARTKESQVKADEVKES